MNVRRSLGVYFKGRTFFFVLKRGFLYFFFSGGNFSFSSFLGAASAIRSVAISKGAELSAAKKRAKEATNKSLSERIFYPLTPIVKNRVLGKLQLCRKDSGWKILNGMDRFMTFILCRNLFFVYNYT